MKVRRILVLGAALGAVLLTVYSRPTPDDIAKANFAAECTAPSDPSDRLLFGHEETVNSFLGVPGKFGPHRYANVYMANEHLATHGGTDQNPESWSEGGLRYELQPNWGMVGSIADPNARVYFFKESEYPGSRAALKKKKEEKPEDPKLSQRAADPFESYALARLKKGDPIVRWERKGWMRAVGAIRASAACQRCHAQKEGELLGAFTYDFATSKAPEPKAELRQVLKLIQSGKSISDTGQELFPNQKGGDMAVRYDLLDAGMVLPEMVAWQQKVRGMMLDRIDQTLRGEEDKAAPSKGSHKSVSFAPPAQAPAAARGNP